MVKEARAPREIGCYKSRLGSGKDRRDPRFNQVDSTLNDLRSLIENGDVDLSDVLVELAKINRNVGDTQALVLAR